jgi:catechol 2,3-dioxygenase-like lactoylglutathione lyase family enzyme
VRLASATPALPATNLARSRDFYVETLGFEVVAEHEGFALLRKDAVTLSLWGATDDTWRARADWARPIQTGAETFIAGTASCAFEISGADELYERCNVLSVVHPNSHIEDTAWGTREFAVLDPDGNLVRFWEPSA